jgi:hypothetical protein
MATMMSAMGSELALSACSVPASAVETNGVMNVVWEHLLPAIVDGEPSENVEARQALEARLASLTLPPQSGAADSPRAAEVSGQRFLFEGDAHGLLAASLELSSDGPRLLVEDDRGVHSISVGTGQWVRGRTRYRKHINDLFDVEEQGVAASGGWADDDTYVAKLCFNETPYTMTMRFHFEGDQLLLDRSYNVRWGSTTEPQLVGAKD